MYATFQYVVIPLGKVSVFQNILLHLGTVAIFICFYKIKTQTAQNFIRHDPRFKPKSPDFPSEEEKSPKVGENDVTISLNAEEEFERNVKEFGPMGAFMVKNFGMDKELVKTE